MSPLVSTAEPNALNAPYEYFGDRNESLADMQSFAATDLKRYLIDCTHKQSESE